MFIRFFYLLRERGLRVSIDQWITLMEALERNMADSSLTAFYNLCRCILVNSETDFDKFDQVFAEFFKGISRRPELAEELIESDREGASGDMLDWLHNTAIPDELYYSPEHMDILRRLEECLVRLLRLMNEQAAASGSVIGVCKVCTGCGACSRGDFMQVRGVFQNQEKAPSDRENPRKSALAMAEQRNFRDFRKDTVLDIRQFQLVFRKLRQYSIRLDVNQLELDVDKTIDQTAKNAGMLSIMYSRPRKNSVKLLVLFDSDGSMWMHADLTNRLFQAVNKSNHFKDLKFYYFHNCIYDNLYTSPKCTVGEWVETEYVMRLLDSEYKVIIVGDASMADRELFDIGGNSMLERSNKQPGLEWLKRLRRHYSKAVWLNPIPESEWSRLYGGKTIRAVGEVFPMFELTSDGVDKAVVKLLVSR